MTRFPFRMARAAVVSARDAEIYASLEFRPAGSVVGRFHYRIIRAMDSGVVTPILLWLLRWPEPDLPVNQRDKALGAIASWLVRRAICRRDPAEKVEEQSTGAVDGRYRPLTDWLRAQTSDELPVSFDYLEEIIEVALPASARTHRPYWKARGVNMAAETLVPTRKS